MQIHGPSTGMATEDIKVRPFGRRGSVALCFPGNIALTMESPDDCAAVIKAALAAKDMLSPTWAVIDPLEGKVAGPMTRAAAEKYIEDNGSYFVGTLTIGPAKQDLDGQRPAPAVTSPVPTRAEDILPDGYRPPAAAVTPWNEPLPARSDA